MIGSLVALALGAALGWVAGHIAVLVPSGRWSSLSAALTALSNERCSEHVTGAVLGAASLGLAYQFRSSAADVVATAGLFVLLIAILLIDLRHHLVYPIMPFIGFLCGLVLNPLTGEAGFRSSLLGGLVAVGLFFLMFLLGLLLFRLQALGFGDVLLAGMIGSIAGLERMPAALFLGIVFSAAAGLALVLTRRKGMREFIPFGSGMCLAAIVVLILR